MTTTTNNISSNSSAFTQSKASGSQTTCNVCKRSLYSFEEVLLCRACHGSYHWRCVDPKTIGQYGQNTNFICEKCNAGSTNTSSQRITNGNSKIPPTDPINADHEDFFAEPNSTKTKVANNIRYFEEKQQQQYSQIPRTTKLNDLDRYLPSFCDDTECYNSNGQEKNDSRTTQRIRQQQNAIESDDDSETAAMFQAKYQYTPLKDYAATRSTRITSDNNLNGHQNFPSDHQTTPRYGGGLHYADHGYDPTTSRLVQTPISGSTHLISSASEHSSMQNPQRTFTSTTNVKMPEKPSRRPQQSHSPTRSTLYSSQIRDNDSPRMKSPSQQHQPDYLSTVGSDSGVNMMNSRSQQSDENQSVERKLTDFVEHLGKQLENDAQKLNEKIESKLKNLENMIHQQTHIIQRQDEMIERLKSQILKIESERDQSRDRLRAHEQREPDDTKTFKSNDSERSRSQDNVPKPKYPINRQDSSTSTTTTNNSRTSSKKVPAPRVNYQRSVTNDDNKPSVTRLVQNVPVNRDRFTSDSSSIPSMTGKLISSVPLTEQSAASSRLDNIIHHSDTKDVKTSSSSNYSLAQVRHQDRQQTVEPVPMTQLQVVTSVHHEENDNDNKTNIQRVRKLNSSSSSSSSTSSESLPTEPVRQLNVPKLTSPDRNLNTHRSLETLQTSHSIDQQFRPTSKTGSLEDSTTSMAYDDPASIYIRPVEASQPAIQTSSIMKGWLRKQNRDSFLKRIELYYCVLANDALLIHRNAQDRTPVKAINLKGAKVRYYDDPKHGPSLELTWSNLSNDPKQYHLYAPNPQEAEQWVTGIQTTIHNLNTTNKWQPYRLNM